MHRIVPILVSVALCVSAIGVFAQETLVVPTDYATIQDAIDAAAEGSTISVETGEYHESLTIAKAITIQGMTGDPKDVVVMPGDWSEPIVTFSEGARLTLSGITITEAWGERAILVSGATYVELINCIVENNYVAIELEEQGAVKAVNCELRGNDEASIRAYGSARVDLRNCTLANSYFDVQVSDDTELSVLSCAFTETGMRAIDVGENSSWNIQDTTFEHIGAEECCPVAIHAAGTSSGSVTGCTFVGTPDPSAYSPGPGAVVPVGDGIEIFDQASVHIADCAFRNLMSGVEVSGDKNSSVVEVSESAFSNCAFAAVRVGPNCPGAQIKIVNNTIGSIGEKATWCCSAVELFGVVESPIEFSGNTIGDTGGCLALRIIMPMCEDRPESDTFVGSLIGSGNVITSDYQHGRRQCPPWRSPFWPKDFVTFED